MGWPTATMRSAMPKLKRRHTNGSRSRSIRSKIHSRVRLDSALHNRLERAAAEAGRTFTSEITQRLQASFEAADLADLVRAAVYQALWDLGRDQGAQRLAEALHTAREH